MQGFFLGVLRFLLRELAQAAIDLLLSTVLGV
jgi:hypothetical protein